MTWGWSDGAKVSCILCHQGVQLISDYSWARPAILVAGKGRGWMLFFFYFFCFFTFIPVPLSPLSLSFISSMDLLSLFSLSLGDDTKWPTRVDVSLNPKTINQSTLWRVLLGTWPKGKCLTAENWTLQITFKHRPSDMCNVMLCGSTKW